MWYMEKVFSGYHNHPIPESLINHPYSARINPLEKELVRVLSKRCTRPIDILSGVKVLNPQNSYSLATIYNEREKFRKESWGERVLMQQLLFLFEEAKYSTAYDRNEENEVEYLFVANPECVQLARCFHQILFMDCTYKTNKYNMPILNFVGQTSTKLTFTVAFCFLKDESKESYLWALQKVKLLYQEGYTPTVLIKDKEQALMWAIPGAFPYARHHLCTFHIWNNVQTNCKRVIWPAKKTEMERIKNLPLEIQQEEKEKFEMNDKIAEVLWAEFQDDWEQLIWSFMEPLYLQREHFVMEKWSTYPDVITYLKNELLDPHKEKFVSAWVNRYRHYDNQATSTVESAHYRFKTKLNGCDGGFVVVFEAMVEYFKRDLDRIKGDFEKSRSRLVTDYRDSPWLRGIILYVSQWEILKMITEVEAWEEHNFPPGMICNCPIKSALGLPCRHAIENYPTRMISIEDINLFWQQLTFKDSSPNQETRQNILEPQKGQGKGSPSNKTTKKQERAEAKRKVQQGPQLTPSMRRDPCAYEKLNELYKLKRKEMEKVGPSGASEMKGKRRKKNVVVASSSKRKVDSGVKIKDPVVPSQQGSTTKEASNVQRKVGGAVGIKQLARSRGNDVKGKVPMVEPSLITPQRVVSNLDGEKKTVFLDVGPMISPPIDEEGNYIRPTYTIYKNYMHFLPHFIHNYVKSTDDVEGDGNCGYHVFVDQLGPFEQEKEWGDDQITYVRQKCLLELRCFPDFYKPMMRFERNDTEEMLNEEFKEFERRLMGNKCLTNSVTYAPTRRVFNEEESPKIVIMGFVNMNHYIGLQLKYGCPLPPLRKVDGCDGMTWCHRFEERFQLWDALQLLRDGPLCVLTSSDEDEYE
ncbi:uncharacterized protein LOC113340536 [Papaver somniferum]|uniref:uncharacterized protein LOC113340536 n=1 Tax=Papaver somniferum TaxID=3469 RepID=UPI000E6FB098|nr:uncharacterized protein LOC113340536 [Papaver somniferum]